MKLTIYRIMSFLLLPMAILFAIGFLMFLRAAFANPPVFISLFFAASIAIYTFASLNFLIKGIDGKKILGRSSKDWLIVNAIVSIIYSLIAIFQRFVLSSNPAIVENYATALKNNGDIKTPDVQINQLINGISYFLMIYGIVLFLHIILSFRYIKQYGYLFQNEKNN
jgi:hypothetical protein